MYRLTGNTLLRILMGADLHLDETPRPNEDQSPLVGFVERRRSPRQSTPTPTSSARSPSNDRSSDHSRDAWLGRAQLDLGQAWRSETNQAAPALSEAAVITAGQGPIFLASGCDAPKLPR